MIRFWNSDNKYLFSNSKWESQIVLLYATLMSKFFKLLQELLKDLCFLHIAFSTLRSCFHVKSSTPVSLAHVGFSDINVCKQGMDSAPCGWWDVTLIKFLPAYNIPKIVILECTVLLQKSVSEKFGDISIFFFFFLVSFDGCTAGP